MCIQERRGTKKESMMEKMGTMWVRLRREWWVSFKCWVVLGEVWMEGDKKWKESECLYWTRERTKTERTILSSTNNRKYSRRKSIYEKKKEKRLSSQTKGKGGFHERVGSCSLHVLLSCPQVEKHPNQ